MGGPQKMIRVNPEPLPGLMKAANEWIDRNGPKPRGGMLSTEEAAKYVLSVIGTLMDVAAGVAAAAQSKEVFVNEGDFLAMAGEHFRAAQKAQKAPRSSPMA